MTTVRRRIGYPANDPVSESALAKHNAESDLYRVLHGHGRVVPQHLHAGQAESPERPAHDRAAEQLWREGSGRGALPEAHGCYEQPGDPPRFTRAFVWRLLLAALAVVALCWVAALWPK